MIAVSQEVLYSCLSDSVVTVSLLLCYLRAGSAMWCFMSVQFSSCLPLVFLASPLSTWSPTPRIFSRRRRKSRSRGAKSARSKRRRLTTPRGTLLLCNPRNELVYSTLECLWLVWSLGGGGQTNQTQSNRTENSIRQSESSMSAKSGVQQLRGGEQGIVQTKPNVSTLNKAQRGRSKTVRKVPDTKDGGNMRQPIRRNIKSGLFRHVRNTISRPQNVPTIKNAVHNRPSAQQSREQIRRPQSEV